MDWPENKDFAFTIFDDTDNATLENVKPVYDLIDDLGFRTTKSVWPSRGNDKPIFGGDTCEDPEYAGWLLELRDKGFEIAYHMNTYHSSTREEIIEGLQRFNEIFGHNPDSMSNHTGCADDIYWGPSRLSGLNKFVYNFLTGFRNSASFFGHVEGSKYFWGDVCRQFIKYCRNFVFRDINTLKQCPFMPYYDPEREYVNNWFASSDGAHLGEFNFLLKEENQDRLEAEGGCCIVYTHLSCGFHEDGRLDSEFVTLMERLSKKNGWYVPVNRLLDYLMEKNGAHKLSKSERLKLERRWLADKVRNARLGKRKNK
ncbi:MAG: hypothetical protein GWO41_16285 [candidate division Zixibacteria bacterium]|nr:hypothetical protein [candidate division Zixibacteria bacterium]NIR63534.1 hypothetical protein [candidate division Zixibacteria bacterium]NIS17968.1 hypothetical protein [candidate division Zixibacteria bacterium]NIS46244.1 hypothetical protein [candidate division Zixibacteria bacterium]NIT54251.1 hypothetical protein [candidate division Zixibacteria bacterium]